MPFITTLLAAACLWSGEPRPQTLTVQIRTTFDRSIKSQIIKSAFFTEAAAIWQPYGVELVWSDEEMPVSTTPTMQLRVAVVRRHGTPVERVGKPVLGVTMMEGGQVLGPIRVQFDEIDSLLHEREGRAQGWHDWEVGR